MIQLKDAFVLIPTAVGFSRSTFHLDDKNAHIDPDRLTRCVMCRLCVLVWETILKGLYEGDLEM